jgi:Glycosyl hydrolases family 2, TIM barrel domain/Glycosyl hydrolases family 2/Glycosyl hydrolases family 2, sugar binding domain
VSDPLSPPPRMPDARPLVRGRPSSDRRAGTFGVLAGGALLAVILAIALGGGGGGSAGDPLPSVPTPTLITGQNVAAPTIHEGPGGRVGLLQWRVRRDPADVGLAEHWDQGHWGGSLERIPYVANALPVTGAEGVRNYAGSVAWYRTNFTLARAGRYALDFQSVNFRATVWLDGRELGAHVGTYLPFAERFSASAGRHVVVVRADWRSPDAQTAEGFHRTWFNFGGINRSVTVRPLGPTDLSAPDVHTTLAGGQAVVDVSVEVRNRLPAARSISVAGVLTRGSQAVPLSFSSVQVRAGGSALASTEVTLDHPVLWSPSHPELYHLRLQTDQQATYDEDVGLRQLTWSHGLLFLNGTRLILHGASIQEDVLGRGDALTPGDEDALVSDLKALGANATRSQHPLDPGLLERLDRAGIVVWQGVGPVDPAGDWTSSTPALLTAAEQRVRVAVRADQAHPSIIAWNLANEVAGNGHPGGQLEYVGQMARTLHERDPGRLVALDVWGEHPPKVAGPLYDAVDAVGETNYAGWYDGPLGASSANAAGVHDFLSSMRHTFPGKVLLISEFGAEANGLNPASAPGGYGFQANLIAQLIGLYSRDPSLSGMLVWDLRDFAVAPTFAGGSIHRRVPGIQLVKGINQKGLMDYSGHPKPAAAVVQRLYEALGGSATP